MHVNDDCEAELLTIFSPRPQSIIGLRPNGREANWKRRVRGAK